MLTDNFAEDFKFFAFIDEDRFIFPVQGDQPGFVIAYLIFLTVSIAGIIENTDLSVCELVLPVHLDGLAVDIQRFHAVAGECYTKISQV